MERFATDLVKIKVCGDGLLGAPAVFPAVQACGLWREMVDVDLESAGSGDGDEALAEADVAVVGGGARVGTVFVFVAEGEGLHGRVGAGCGFEERGFEGQELVASSGGAFGEDGYAFSASQARGHGMRRACGGSPAATLDEECAGVGDQISDRGPVADIFLADEGGGRNCVDHEHVEPGNVVADD